MSPLGLVIVVGVSSTSAPSPSVSYKNKYEVPETKAGTSKFVFPTLKSNCVVPISPTSCTCHVLDNLVNPAGAPVAFQVAAPLSFAIVKNSLSAISTKTLAAFVPSVSASMVIIPSAFTDCDFI